MSDVTLILSQIDTGDSAGRRQTTSFNGKVAIFQQRRNGAAPRMSDSGNVPIGDLRTAGFPKTWLSEDRENDRD